MEPKLHVLVDSRESSVSFAREFFRDSGFVSLGVVEHIRGISFAKRVGQLLGQCSTGDEVLISVHYLPEEQLSNAACLLNEHGERPRITLATYDCFRHMRQWAN